MSNHLEERARKQQLLEQMNKQQQEEFIRFAEDYLGAYCGADCDDMVDKMSDDQFVDTVKVIIDAWKKRRRRSHAELEELIEVPAGVY